MVAWNIGLFGFAACLAWACLVNLVRDGDVLPWPFWCAPVLNPPAALVANRGWRQGRTGLLVLGAVIAFCGSVLPWFLAPLL